MAHGRAQYGTDLLSTSQDVLTALDRSAMALNMIAHTLENEFSERFGHTGVRGHTSGGAALAQMPDCDHACADPYRRWCTVLQLLGPCMSIAGYAGGSSKLKAVRGGLAACITSMSPYAAS